MGVFGLPVGGKSDLTSMATYTVVCQCKLLNVLVARIPPGPTTQSHVCGDFPAAGE